MWNRPIQGSIFFKYVKLLRVLKFNNADHLTIQKTDSNRLTQGHIFDIIFIIKYVHVF